MVPVPAAASSNGPWRALGHVPPFFSAPDSFPAPATHTRTVLRGSPYAIQNDLIEAVRGVRVHTIIEELASADFVAILLDKSSHTINKLQLSIIFRYVDKSGEVEERVASSHFIATLKFYEVPQPEVAWEQTLHYHSTGLQSPRDYFTGALWRMPRKREEKKKERKKKTHTTNNNTYKLFLKLEFGEKFEKPYSLFMQKDAGLGHEITRTLLSLGSMLRKLGTFLPSSLHMLRNLRAIVTSVGRSVDEYQAISIDFTEIVEKTKGNKPCSSIYVNEKRIVKRIPDELHVRFGIEVLTMIRKELESRNAAARSDTARSRSRLSRSHKSVQLKVGLVQVIHSLPLSILAPRIACASTTTAAKPAVFFAASPNSRSPKVMVSTGQASCTPPHSTFPGQKQALLLGGSSSKTSKLLPQYLVHSLSSCTPALQHYVLLSVVLNLCWLSCALPWLDSPLSLLLGVVVVPVESEIKLKRCDKDRNIFIWLTIHLLYSTERRKEGRKERKEGRKEEGRKEGRKEDGKKEKKEGGRKKKGKEGRKEGRKEEGKKGKERRQERRKEEEGKKEGKKEERRRKEGGKRKEEGRRERNALAMLQIQQKILRKNPDLLTIKTFVKDIECSPRFTIYCKIHLNMVFLELNEVESLWTALRNTQWKLWCTLEVFRKAGHFVRFASFNDPVLDLIILCMAIRYPINKVTCEASRIFHRIRLSSARIHMMWLSCIAVSADQLAVTGKADSERLLNKRVPSKTERNKGNRKEMEYGVPVNARVEADASSRLGFPWERSEKTYFGSKSRDMATHALGRISLEKSNLALQTFLHTCTNTFSLISHGNRQVLPGKQRSLGIAAAQVKQYKTPIQENIPKKTLRNELEEELYSCIQPYSDI
ncbi:Protein split ends [Gryllus bimaculatus]|nr:Protein split ends [Gryllus bimaculatus]